MNIPAVKMVSGYQRSEQVGGGEPTVTLYAVRPGDCGMVFAHTLDNWRDTNFHVEGRLWTLSKMTAAWVAAHCEYIGNYVDPVSVRMVLRGSRRGR